MRRGRADGTCRSGGRRGQALLVAVLLMMAILLIGILFVALVTYNQSQSTRHEDLVAAQALAEAGIRYANEQLMTSPLAADWRPPEPPATYTDGSQDPEVAGPDGLVDTEDDYYTSTELERGWAPLVDAATGEYVRRGYSRVPDTRRPGATTDAASNLVLGGGYFLVRVTYDPWQPGEPGTPDPLSWNIKIESIGRVDATQVYRKLVAYKPIPMLNYARLVTDATGDGRAAVFGVPPYIDMDNDGTIPPGTSAAPSVEWLPTTIRGPVHVNGQMVVAGAPHLDPGAGTPLEGSTKFELLDTISPAGYARDDVIAATGGIENLDDIDNAAEVTVDDGVTTTTAFLLESTDPAFDTMGGHVRDGVPGTAAGASRFAARVGPPPLTLDDGARFDGYRELTRDSGDTLEYPVGSGEYVNTGAWGFGAGIYIDNFDDVQYNHDIQLLLADWERPSAAGGMLSADSGWNALYTTYSPPAVVVELLPTEAAAGTYETSINPSDVDAGEVWWPGHEAGQPGIRITRYDGKHWRTDTGDDSGLSTRLFDYPTMWLDGTPDEPANPIIVAEGNVRISGQLPEAMAVAGDLRRPYDITVVSGGTIYIDGQILAPNDRLGAPVADEFNTRIALLARDCVCLNATQIVPQLTAGTAPAVPDDPLNPQEMEKHWELAPGADGRAYSTFFWGDAPLGAGRRLIVRQAGGDPGPAGVSLTEWVSGAGYTAHIFGGAPPPMLDTTFALVPPAAVFPDGSLPPQLYGVEGIAPQWAPYREPAAGLPWALTALNATPGLPNGIVLAHADPNMSAGSTSYWVKKWKVNDFNPDDLPVGSINAQVSATVYAERGCWYVLTADYFDDQVTGGEAVENRRYNYKLTFTGTIAENFTASVEAVQAWTDKMAYPAAYSGPTLADLSEWGTIEYQFDETLRLVRYHSTLANPTNPAANLPRVPLLPVSPDLVYYGEAQ